MRIEGKVAFITGAANGIGREAAALFVREGARVVIADTDEAAGERAASHLTSTGGSVRFVRTDVTDARSLEAAVSEAVAEWGRLDILFNNAGGSTVADGPVTETRAEDFWHTIRLDLFGTWLSCKHAIPQMIRTGGGSVINMSSMVALMGYPGKDSYTAAKGAIAALTRSMAIEFAPNGIRVNAIAPGVTLTSRVADRVADKLIPQGLLDRHLLGLLEPIQIARVALFLASDDSCGMTGHVVPVDSGITIT